MIKKLTEKISTFAPRLITPSTTNKYYYSSINPFYASGYGLPNCTAYAYGRIYELINESPKLCLRNAKEWWDYNKNNSFYNYGQTPKLGAVACWGAYGNYTYGHIAVVEKITSTKVTVSESQYSSKVIFTTHEFNKGDYTYSWNKNFLGFIYPADFGDDSSEDNNNTNSNEKRTFDFFRSKGCSIEATCGIMGNARAESSFSTTVVNPSSGTTGLFQWGWTRLDNLKNLANWTSLDVQLNFAWSEFTGQECSYWLKNFGGLSKFQNLTDVTQACIAWEEIFERSGGQGNSLRIQYALEFYEQYKNDNTPGEDIQKGITTDNLNLRTDPTTSSSIILTIPKGSVIIILEKLTDWYKVNYNNNIGYVFSKYVELENKPSVPEENFGSSNPLSYPMPTRALEYVIPVMTGDDVKYVQAGLKRLGYNVAIDGKFGPSSKEATINFQKDNGLNSEGYFGSLSLNRLRILIGDPYLYPIPTRALQYTIPVMTGNDVKFMQSGLKYLGYNIDVDGSFGPGAKSAVIEFQKDNGLNAEGYFGTLSINKMQQLLKK